jgi:Flp pilus assembly protein TadG
MQAKPRRSSRGARRGSSTIELAVCLPMLFILLFGIMEVGRGLEVYQIMTSAVREGGRFGATDKQGMIPSGSTTNQKIVDDVRNYLVASGLPGGLADVEVLTVPGSGGTPADFDFEDANNHLQNFQVKVSMPYSAVTYLPTQLQGYFAPTEILIAQCVFRNYHK